MEDFVVLFAQVGRLLFYLGVADGAGRAHVRLKIDDFLIGHSFVAFWHWLVLLVNDLKETLPANSFTTPPQHQR